MDKEKILSSLKKKMQEDQSLPLRKTANNLVFGGGNLDAEVVFVGEGPGYWEDLKGIPFVGRAGALLNYFLSQIGLKREDVYITNVVHFRPPQNRDPFPEEIEAFKPYLDEIIKTVDPKIIVTLGRFSMAKFLPGVKISSVHGNVYNLVWNERNVVVIPMYHPAAALRSKDIMYLAREDFKKIPGILSSTKEDTKEKEDKAEQMSLV